MWLVSVPSTSAVPSFCRFVSSSLGSLIPSRCSSCLVLFGLLLGLLAGGLLDALLEAVEETLVDLVVAALVVDVGGVAGGDQPAVEVEALSLGGAVGADVEVELGNLVVALALERAAELGVDAAALVTLDIDVELQREVAALDRVGVAGEGLVEDLARVLSTTAAATAAAGGERRGEHDEDGDRQQQAQAGQEDSFDSGSEIGRPPGRGRRRVAHLRKLAQRRLDVRISLTRPCGRARFSTRARAASARPASPPPRPVPAPTPGCARSSSRPTPRTASRTRSRSGWAPSRPRQATASGARRCGPSVRWRPTGRRSRTGSGSCSPTAGSSGCGPRS